MLLCYGMVSEEFTYFSGISVSVPPAPPHQLIRQLSHLLRSRNTLQARAGHVTYTVLLFFIFPDSWLKRKISLKLWLII